MISIVIFVPGPAPRPRRRPMRALAGEEVLGEPPVDDGRGRHRLDVHRGEVAPFEKRIFIVVEVAGHQAVHVGLHVLAVLGLMALDLHGAVPLVAAQDRNRGHPGGDHTRRGAEPLEHLLIEAHRPLEACTR